MMRFRLVIISNYAEEIIEILNDFLRKIFPNTSVSHIIYKDPPKEYYDHFRRQYRADLMLTWLAGFKEDLDEITVGVLDYDGYVPGLNFIFGVADPYLKTASVYTLRLYRGYDRKIDEIFIERLKKEVLHEIGHVLGLEHCDNRRCVMSFSNSIYEVDLKTYKFCRRCFEKLTKRGIMINREAVLA